MPTSFVFSPSVIGMIEKFKQKEVIIEGYYANDLTHRCVSRSNWVTSTFNVTNPQKKMSYLKFIYPNIGLCDP